VVKRISSGEHRGSTTCAATIARSPCHEKCERFFRSKKLVQTVEERLKHLGEDVSEILEYVPASLKVIQYIRPKLACASCDRIVQAAAPSRPIERSIAGPGLLAQCPDIEIL